MYPRILLTRMGWSERSSDDPARVLLLTDDVGCANALLTRLEQAGHTVTWHSSLADVSFAIASFSPDIIIAAEAFRESSSIEALTPIKPSVPVIFLSNDASILLKLRAIRAGGRVCLPLDPASVLDHVNRLVAMERQLAGHVLLIDSQVERLNQWYTVLVAAGITVSTVREPLLTLENLASINPDLILVAWSLPDLSSWELALLIRQQFPNLALMFLTEPADQADVRRRGEDYIPLDLPWSECVAIVQGRISRSRQLQQYMAEARQLAADNLALQAMVMCDPLTGAANRRGFDQYVLATWNHLMRKQAPLAIVIIDIDFFKLFNDTYGHLDGDRCLQDLVRVLQEVTRRANDQVARLGGEEFALVLSDTDGTGALQVVTRMQRLLAKLSIPNTKSPIGGILTISAGVAWMIPDNKAQPEALLLKADRALYAAKAAGRNRVVVIDPEETVA